MAPWDWRNGKRLVSSKLVTDDGATSGTSVPKPPNPGYSAPPPPSPAYGGAKARTRKPTTCSRLSKTGSPRALIRPI